MQALCYYYLRWDSFGASGPPEFLGFNHYVLSLSLVCLSLFSQIYFTLLDNIVLADHLSPSTLQKVWLPLLLLVILALREVSDLLFPLVLN